MSPKPPESRPSDAVLQTRIEAEAKRHFARVEGFQHYDVVEEITSLFKEEVHRDSCKISGSGKIPCELCNREPLGRWYVNVHLPLPLRGDRPVFVSTIGPIDAVSPALCHLCVRRDWKAWEADVESILRKLHGADLRDRQAATELDIRFRRRPVRSAAGRCDLCGSRGGGVQGCHAFVCALCMSEAKSDFTRAHVAMMKEMDDRKRREEEEKNRPFPDDVREEARRVAAHLGARRVRALAALPRPLEALEVPRGEPDEAAWDEVRGWFLESSPPYGYMNAFRERSAAAQPPADVVDLVAGRYAGLLESVALDGYRQRHKGMLTGDKDVVGESWPAHEAAAFLWQSRPSPAARARIDQAIVLLRLVIETGVSYCRWDRPFYEDVTEAYVQLITSLYDYRRSSASALREGALLLHGGRAEDRLEIAREIHLSRTGGLDARAGISFVVIGRGEGEVPFMEAKGNATVFIPEPLALSPDEQRHLFYRLRPSGPPEPTLLGADSEERFREQAQSRMLEELVPRLYTFEQDIRRELEGVKA